MRPVFAGAVLVVAGIAAFIEARSNRPLGTACARRYAPGFRPTGQLTPVPPRPQ
jgi:hypothetical protein